MIHQLKSNYQQVPYGNHQYTRKNSLLENSDLFAELTRHADFRERLQEFNPIAGALVHLDYVHFVAEIWKQINDKNYYNLLNIFQMFKSSLEVFDMSARYF